MVHLPQQSLCWPALPRLMGSHITGDFTVAGQLMSKLLLLINALMRQVRLEASGLTCIRVPSQNAELGSISRSGGVHGPGYGVIISNLHAFCMQYFIPMFPLHLHQCMGAQRPRAWPMPAYVAWPGPALLVSAEDLIDMCVTCTGQHARTGRSIASTSHQAEHGGRWNIF